ncbi:MAG: HIT domain-containing protein [Candidatus Omnitrophica bacterium]|nr:HIT domain-containing protein [Candidatus Omnitrophota bacterium]
MQRLWAPWREKYVTKIAGKKTACVFCQILASRQDNKNLVLFRSPHAAVLLNLYPYSNGHCLVIARRHVSDISPLSQEEYSDLMENLKTAKDLVQSVFNPEGFNVGINLGRVAGAGIPGHIHIHIVPRWASDHNFMPVVSDTRVISQSLNLVYQKLHDAYKKRYRRTRK